MLRVFSYTCPCIIASRELCEKHVAGSFGDAGGTPRLCFSIWLGGMSGFVPPWSSSTPSEPEGLSLGAGQPRRPSRSSLSRNYNYCLAWLLGSQDPGAS